MHPRAEESKVQPRILQVLLRAASILLLILYCFSRNKAPQPSCSDYSAEQKEKRSWKGILTSGVEFWPINPGQSTLTIAISNNRFASLAASKFLTDGGIFF